MSVWAPGVWTDGVWAPGVWAGLGITPSVGTILSSRIVVVPISSTARVLKLKDVWGANDVNWLHMSWVDLLVGATIESSSWILPSTWSQVSTYTDMSVTDEAGKSYQATNGVLASGGSEGTKQTIYNRVVLSDGREVRRGVKVQVL